MMGFAQRTLRFGSGLIFGAAIGTAISVLLAPQSGEELKAELADRLEEAKRAGEEAELLETERLKRLYREAVHNPTALTGQFDERKTLLSPAEEAAAKLKKEQEEAAKARRDERKATEAVAKAQEQARKAHEKAQKEEADVARAYDEAVDKSARS
jgi:gas vesicle protein